MKIKKDTDTNYSLEISLSLLADLRKKLPHLRNADYAEGDAVTFADGTRGYYIGCYRKAFNININHDFKTVSITPRTDDLYYYIYVLGSFHINPKSEDKEFLKFEAKKYLQSKEKIKAKTVLPCADVCSHKPTKSYMSEISSVADLWKLEFWENILGKVNEEKEMKTASKFPSYKNAPALLTVIKVLFDIIVKIIKLELTIKDNEDSKPYLCDCDGLIDNLKESNVEEMLFLNEGEENE